MLNLSQERYLMVTLGEVEDKLRRLKGLLQDEIHVRRITGFLVSVPIA
jgi:hypothetical protein